MSVEFLFPKLMQGQYNESNDMQGSCLSNKVQQFSDHGADPLLMYWSDEIKIIEICC